MTSKYLSKNARISTLKMVHKAKASHVASALSIIDILAVLYSEVMNIDPDEPFLVDRDRFILSKGHACAGVYAVLAELGFIQKESLTTYGEDFSILMNHISHKVPGVEFSTGSLGHGLPFGVGKALAATRLQKSWLTFVLLSDGELQEGSNWEALMFAAHHKLDNLVVIVDNNNLQSLTTVEETVNIQSLKEKVLAFGWEVRDVDGHNHEQVKANLSQIPWQTDKPSLLIANTIKGKGVSFMENRVEWHYRSPTDEQLKLALWELEQKDA
jgi:transketolase